MDALTFPFPPRPGRGGKFSGCGPKGLVGVERREFLYEGFGQAFRLFIATGAAMKGLGFEDEFAVLIENAVAEVQAHALHPGHPDLDGQQVVVTRRVFVAQPHLDDGKNVVGRLQGRDRFAN